MDVIDSDKECYVDVCGLPFLVKEIESNGRGDPSMGRSDSKLATITINKEMPKELKDSTLIHEWLHSVLDSTGFGDVSNNENLICVLQNELYRAGFRIKCLCFKE